MMWLGPQGGPQKAWPSNEALGVPYFQTNLNLSCPVSYNIHQYTLIRPLYQLYTNYIPTIYQLYTNYIPTIYQLYLIKSHESYVDFRESPDRDLAEAVTNLATGGFNPL